MHHIVHPVGLSFVCLLIACGLCVCLCVCVCVIASGDVSLHERSGIGQSGPGGDCHGDGG